MVFAFIYQKMEKICMYGSVKTYFVWILVYDSRVSIKNHHPTMQVRSKVNRSFSLKPKFGVMCPRHDFTAFNLARGAEVRLSILVVICRHMHCTSFPNSGLGI